MASRVEGDTFFDGELSSKRQLYPTGSISNDAIAANAKIGAGKLEHLHAISYRQTDGADVVSKTEVIHTFKGVAGLVDAVEVVCKKAPAGAGDKQFTVDVLKASQASPVPVSVLQVVIVYDDSKADFEVVAGTVNNGVVADDDTLIVVVTVSGTTGTQGQGLAVTVNVREDSQ